DKEPDDFVAHWYKVDQSYKAYQVFVEAVNGETLWLKSTAVEMLPPLARRMPRRPKKARRKSIPEEPRTDVSRVGRLMTCNNCKQPRHCKNPKVNGTQTSQAEPRPKKRKEKPPGGYGVHTFEDGTQYIRLPGWKRGKYFDPRSVEASQTNTGERIQTSQASSSGANATSTRSGKAGNGSSKGTRILNAPTNAPTSVVNGGKTSNVGAKPGNGARTVNGAKNSNVGAKPGNGARTGTNGTTIQPIGVFRPEKLKGSKIR
ncbi:hypothetical protein FRX31_019705, partial [Thalictrum thalictroides]